MGVIKEKYSNSRLTMLQEVLTTDAENGQPRDFEVWVDDLKVIQRTSNAERFDSYEGFVNADTRSVTVVIYEKGSRRNTRYIFLLKEEDPVKDKEAALNGIEKSFNEKLEQQKKDWQHDLLVKEKEKLENDLEEAQEYIDNLETALEQEKGKKNKLGDIHIGDIASVALEGIIRRNPQLLTKLPGGEGLAGIIIQDNQEKAKQLATANEPDTEVTFKRKDNAEELSAEDKDYLGFLKQLKGKFDETQLIKVMSVLDMFAEDTSSIDPAIEFLKGNTQKEKKAAA